MTLQQCHIANALIGKRTVFPASIFWQYFAFVRAGDLRSFPHTTENRRSSLWITMLSFVKSHLIKMKRVKLTTVRYKISDESAEDGSTEIFSQLPGRQKISRTWNTKCKEAVKHLNMLTHIVEDTESLKQVHALLHQCIKIFNQASLKDDGLILEKPEKFKRFSKSNSASSKSARMNTTFKENTKATRRNPFSGRHGSRPGQ